MNNRPLSLPDIGGGIHRFESGNGHSVMFNRRKVIAMRAAMFLKGDRVFIKSGVGAGMWATVARTTRPDSFPLVHAVVDGARCQAGYSFHYTALTRGSRSTVIAIRPRGVVAIYGE